MKESVSILDVIKKGSYEASFISTYNAYLPFYEEVVLRKLIQSGSQNNVLMMDYKQYSNCLLSTPPRLAGKQYTLIPVNIAGAFHPKLILLIGKKKVTAFVGSHNLTLSGFGFNREITNLIKFNSLDDGIDKAILFQLNSAINKWLTLVESHVPKHLIKMVKKAQDSLPKLTTIEENKTDKLIIESGPKSTSLWSQITPLINTRVKSVTFVGPYFDNQLKFLKTIKSELSPEKMIVGIDPQNTVAPDNLKDMEGIVFKNTNAFGPNQSKNDTTTSFLHAKMLYLTFEDNSAIYISGSPNPSFPAWLAADNKANVELALVHQGDAARDIANSLEIPELVNAENMTEEDWEQCINNNKSRDNIDDDVFSAPNNGIGIVNDNSISIELDQDFIQSVIKIELLDSDKLLLKNISLSSMKNDACQFTIEDELKVAATFVKLSTNNTSCLVLLHNENFIEEQSRTGIQRSYKTSLLSLSTDSPDLQTLMQCVEKIIFEDKSEITQKIKTKLPARDEANNESDDGDNTLAIDINDVKIKNKKYRLSQNSDLAYLLDTLIYHLRISDEDSIEVVDHMGRTEEEQVGTDDEIIELKESNVDSDAILKFCHGKITTLVNRIGKQLMLYAEGKLNIQTVIVRLIAVLALLRQLRACDNNVSWVKLGQSTVPQKSREKLLNFIMASFFEGKLSLANQLDKLEIDFDEYSRLLGLITWLAWDTKMNFKSFSALSTSHEKLREYLEINTVALHLLKLIKNDSDALEECSKSITACDPAEIKWLNFLLKLSKNIDKAVHQHKYLDDPNKAVAGDIAIHKSIDKFGLRIVESNRDNKFFNLVCLSENKKNLSIPMDNLNIIPISNII